MVGFTSKETTPPAEDIGTAVTNHYSRLGYRVEPTKLQTQHSFETLVFFGTKDKGCIHIIITTFYPLVLGDEHNHIRVSTSVLV